MKAIWQMLKNSSTSQSAPTTNNNNNAENPINSNINEPVAPQEPVAPDFYPEKETLDEYCNKLRKYRSEVEAYFPTKDLNFSKGLIVKSLLKGIDEAITFFSGSPEDFEKFKQDISPMHKLSPEIFQKVLLIFSKKLKRVCANEIKKYHEQLNPTPKYKVTFNPDYKAAIPAMLMGEEFEKKNKSNNVFDPFSGLEADDFLAHEQWMDDFVSALSPLFDYDQSRYQLATKEMWLNQLVEKIQDLTHFINLTEFSLSFTEQQVSSPDNVIRSFIEKLYQFVFSCQVMDISVEECQKMYQKMLVDHIEKLTGQKIPSEFVEKIIEHVGKVVKEKLPIKEFLNARLVALYVLFVRGQEQITSTLSTVQGVPASFYENNINKYVSELSSLAKVKPYTFEKSLLNIFSNEFMPEQVSKFICDCASKKYDAILTFLKAHLSTADRVAKSKSTNYCFITELQKKFDAIEDKSNISDYVEQIIVVEAAFQNKGWIVSGSIKNALPFVKSCLNELTPAVPKQSNSNQNDHPVSPSSLGQNGKK